jgi:hypothetical protein
MRGSAGHVACVVARPSPVEAQAEVAALAQSLALSHWLFIRVSGSHNELGKGRGDHLGGPYVSDHVDKQHAGTTWH